MTPLTDQQQKALDFIAHYARKAPNRSPTYKEIMIGIEARSTSRVADLVRALEARGHLTRIPNRARTLKVVSHEISVPLNFLPPDLQEAVHNEARQRGLSDEAAVAYALRERYGTQRTGRQLQEGAP